MQLKDIMKQKHRKNKEVWANGYHPEAEAKYGACKGKTDKFFVISTLAIEKAKISYNKPLVDAEDFINYLMENNWFGMPNGLVKVDGILYGEPEKLTVEEITDSVEYLKQLSSKLPSTAILANRLSSLPITDLNVYKDYLEVCFSRRLLEKEIELLLSLKPQKIVNCADSWEDKNYTYDTVELYWT